VTVVISGAGLSVVTPGARWTSIGELKDEAFWGDHLARWRLETLVGMLRGVIGERALDPTRLVLEGSPNRAHELAAQLLSGTSPLHLTFNFDDFVERAYEELTGSPPEVLTPKDPARLVELAHADWTTLDRPVVVHVHGRVARTAQSVQFPGLVVTLDTIQGPPPRWLEPLLRRALAEDVVVTGYSGLDTDVWPVFVRASKAVRGRSRVWNSLSLDGISDRVKEELGGFGFHFTEGGSAAALSRALGTPETSTNDRGVFAADQVARIMHLSPTEGTLVLAWTLEDVGGEARGLASELLGEGPPSQAEAQVRWRWWMKMGTVRREAGYHQDALPYLKRARREAPRWDVTRAALRLDAADCYRHLVREGNKSRRIAALGMLEISLAAARAGSIAKPGRAEVVQRANRIRAHIILRVLDSRSEAPRALRRLLALRAARLLRRAVKGPSPHTTMFAYLQLAEAIAHASLAGGRGGDEAATAALAEARGRAEFIAHTLGDGNVLCARGLVAGAAGDVREAERCLEEAFAVYDGADHQSGRDLVAARRRLLLDGRPPG
jgi:hypothetical protein